MDLHISEKEVSKFFHSSSSFFHCLYLWKKSDFFFHPKPYPLRNIYSPKGVVPTVPHVPHLLNSVLVRFTPETT